MTALEIVTGAMRLAGVLGHGQTPSPEEAAAGLEVLNNLLDQWSAQHKYVFVIDNKQMPLTSGVGSYTMGPGGDWDTERPVKIQSAGVIYYKTTPEDLLDGIRKKLQLVNSEDWAKIEEKSMTAYEPLKLYSTNEYPLTALKLWPVPICP